jgi:integrase
MSKLTEKNLQAIRPGQKGEKVFDDGGLRGTVRVGKSGDVSVFFVWRYKFDGRQKDIACGTWPSESLANVRKERDRLRRILEQGKDPAVERKSAKLQVQIDQQAQLAALEQQAARATVNDLFERWLGLELAKRKESSRLELERSFRKNVLPVIGQIPAEDVGKAHVMKVLDNILARGANRLANRTLSEMRQMFGFGYTRDIVKTDPTHRITKADVGGKETERERVLRQDEIAELARKIPGANLLVSSECAIWIMLSTGVRVGDLMKARWTEFDFAARTWTFVPEKDQTHIKRRHTLFLSGFALGQFERLHEVNGAGEWLYPDSTGAKPVCKKSITKQIGDRQTDKPRQNQTTLADSLLLSGGRWTPHDLRRSCATLARDLGFSKELADRLIYHLEQDKLARIYQRHDAQAEMNEAWRMIGERLELLTREDAGNVVILDRFRQTEAAKG